MRSPTRHGTARALLAIAASALASACAARPHDRGPAPDALVVVHFDAERTVALERTPGDTVRMRDVTSITGRVRATRGDTTWIDATEVRTPFDDGRGRVPGWRVAVVTDAHTRPVPLWRDTHTRWSTVALTIAGIVGVLSYLVATGDGWSGG